MSGAQSHAETSAWRFVHLAEDHDGLIDDVFAGVADLGFLHFEPEVGPFAGSFADAGEDGITAVLLGDAGDEFLNDDGFAETRAAEESGLAAAKERREQVDHLDAGLEDFGFGGQVDEFRRLAVDGPALCDVHGAAIVDRFAEQIEDAAEGFLADRDGHGASRCRAHPCRGEGRRWSPAPRRALVRRRDVAGTSPARLHGRAPSVRSRSSRRCRSWGADLRGIRRRRWSR